MRIGMVGYQFMGRAHAHAYRTAPYFFPIKSDVQLAAVCGLGQEGVAAFAERQGFESYHTDWREMVARDDIDIIDIAAPNNVHAPIAIAAAQAGKHVLLEKPMAMNLTEAREMLATAEAAGIHHMIGFNYRRVPAIALAKAIIDAGDIGDIVHWRAVYNQDWLADPTTPRFWRMDKSVAGTGAIGDLAAHIVDLAHYLVGPIEAITGMAKTFYSERPSVDDPSRKVPVTVDDAFAFLARFDNGATGTFEGTRLATGRLNYNGWEINGSKGSLAFNLERMNELQVFFRDDPVNHRGWRVINVTDGQHPYVGAWWPPGHIIGWEESHIHQIADFLMAVENDRPCSPDFAVGVQNQAVLDALVESADSGQWVDIVQE